MPDAHDVKSKKNIEEESVNSENRDNETEQVHIIDISTGSRNTRGEMIVNRNFWDNTTISPYTMECLTLQADYKNDDGTKYDDESKHGVDDDGDDSDDDDHDDLYETTMVSRDAERCTMSGLYANKCYCEGMFLN